MKVIKKIFITCVICWLLFVILTDKGLSYLAAEALLLSLLAIFALFE